jgi:ABC-type transport system substrate-binding protein
LPYEYNPEKAKQLLAEAGYPNGFETNTFNVPLAYYPANSDVMQVLAGYWRDIGITINETTVEYRPTLRTKLVDGTTDNLLYTYTQPLVYSPFIYFGSACCFTSGGVLYHLATEFMDDKWKNHANKEYDAVKQGAIMMEIGDYIYDNYIGIPIAATRTLIAVNIDTVGEWQPSPGRSFIHDVAYAEPK